MSKIFISYRRDDSQDVVGRIYDHLAATFGKDYIFKDVDSIPLGVNFRTHIEQTVQSCDVVVAVIGKRWLELTDASGNRRIDDPNDFVRTEIESCLIKNTPLIPVLVSNASIPTADELPLSIRQLVSLNGLKVRPDPDFKKDINKLITSISIIVKPRVNYKIASHSLLFLFVMVSGSVGLGYRYLYLSDPQESHEPTRETRKKFFGKLDGIYEGTGENRSIQLTIADTTNDLELLVDNCSFLGHLSQADNYWNITAKGQDGMCDMVDTPFIDKEVGRITPVKGNLTNSGRVMKALVNFSIGSLARFSGIYDFKYNDLADLRRSLGYDK